MYVDLSQLYYMKEFYEKFEKFAKSYNSSVILQKWIWFKKLYENYSKNLFSNYLWNFLEKPVFPIAESSVLLNHISVVTVSSSIDQRLRKRTKYSKVWKIANFLAKMSLYPSLEDMQVDQMVKVSTYSIIRSPDPLFF